MYCAFDSNVFIFIMLLSCHDDEWLVLNRKMAVVLAINMQYTIPSLLLHYNLHEVKPKDRDNSFLFKTV